MKNIIRKLSIISIIIIFTVSILSGCNINEGKTDNNKQQDKLVKDMDIEVTSENAKVLEIEEPKIINETTDVNQTIDTQTKVTNISKFNIKDIHLVYREYDKDNNALSTAESFIELTLKPNEVARIQASHKKHVKRGEVVKYSYVVGNKLVNVDLNGNKVNIVENDQKIFKSKRYDILAISDSEQISQVKDGYNSKIIIKNLSDNDIGSVSIIMGELNDSNEYIGVSYLDSYEVIKSSQEVELDSVHSNDVKNLEVLGYIYDDVSENRTIDINLKLSQATIIKN